MESAKRRELKRAGKAALERRSAELRAALQTANPAPPGSDQWAQGYRVSVEREQWLRTRLPIIHKDQLAREFVVHHLPKGSGTDYVGGYVLCRQCGSAVPSSLPWRLCYFAGCACGSVRWWCLLWWRRVIVKKGAGIAPVQDEHKTAIHRDAVRLNGLNSV